MIPQCSLLHTVHMYHTEWLGNDLSQLPHYARHAVMLTPSIILKTVSSDDHPEIVQ